MAAGLSLTACDGSGSNDASAGPGSSGSKVAPQASPYANGQGVAANGGTCQTAHLTFTSLIVTPPNETHSHTMALAINIPAGNSGPVITVDPLGAGK